jgi:hypothetical protein
VVDNKESKEPDYDDDKDQLEEKQEEEAKEIDQGETNNESSFLNFSPHYNLLSKFSAV